MSNAESEHWRPQYIPLAAVEEYKSASLNKDPLLYPGTRPEDSYVTDGANVYGLHVIREGAEVRVALGTPSGETNIDDFLAASNAPSLKDRIPVLAFGANMCPGSLKAKYQKVGRDDALVVPTVYGSLDGYDVVWSGVPGVNGNFTANLYHGPETAGTNVQVGVNFLTREQLLVMHATELNYNLAAIEVTVAGGPMTVYYYTGKDSVLIQDGAPVAVAGVPAENRALHTADTAALLDLLLQPGEELKPLFDAYPDLEHVHAAQEYVEYMRNFKSDGGNTKLDLKQAMLQRLLEIGRAKTVEPDRDTGLASWANPSTLPTYGESLQGIQRHDVYRLPSEELRKDQWNDDASRNKVLKSMAAHLVRTSDGELRFKSGE
jgi:hypothetical protein